MPVSMEKVSGAVAQQIRVVLADDHAVLRAGLRALIDAEEGLQVVGEATNAQEAIDLAGSVWPDVLVLDIAMPGGGTIEAIKHLKKSQPALRVLVLSMYDEKSYLHSVLEAGAAGFVTKKAADDALLTAIRTVHAGRSYVDVSLDGAAPPAPPTSISSSKLEALSAREQDVLRLLARGHTNREIAEKLGIGVKSVDTYRSRMSDKLGIRSRAELVQFALEAGLLVADDSS